ncbi:MAG TPA: hypothetical protein VF593_10765 [Chthoniobacteraceae bacterium]
MPFRYLLAGVTILALFVAAIVLPDVLPYVFPNRILQPPVSGAVTSGSSTAPSIPAPPSTTALPLSGAPMATVQLFETYARLVTLFIGVASVLGLFFGYFVRKSLRETEEDVDKRFDRSLTLWEKERTALLEQYKADAAILKVQIETSKNLEEKMRSDMRELADTLESNRTVSKASAPPVNETAASVDEQLQNL